MQEFTQASSPRAPRASGPPQIAEGAEHPIAMYFQKCSSAEDINAAFDFAEVGTFRWQLINYVTLNRAAARRVGMSHFSIKWASAAPIRRSIVTPSRV
jgi:hypothetical protein